MSMFKFFAVQELQSAIADEGSNRRQ